jgi:hypothetical protein
MSGRKITEEEAINTSLSMDTVDDISTRRS